MSLVDNICSLIEIISCQYNQTLSPTMVLSSKLSFSHNGQQGTTFDLRSLYCSHSLVSPNSHFLSLRSSRPSHNLLHIFLQLLILLSHQLRRHLLPIPNSIHQRRTQILGAHTSQVFLINIHIRGLISRCGVHGKLRWDVLDGDFNLAIGRRANYFFFGEFLIDGIFLCGEFLCLFEHGELIHHSRLLVSVGSLLLWFGPEEV
mmetsp:Transcript_20442/g.35132  ORF Transcript_20442/g.35132 Transcript_20442/m.35132 type:complete len:203 (+) Transcript_20442:49-657(+)